MRQLTLRERLAALAAISILAVGLDAAAGRMTSSAALVGTQIETLRTEALRFTVQLKAAG